jgi:hypothetical protein
MPPKTTVPMACWLAAPAPPGDQEGDPPRIKAKEVILMRRKRRLVASTAASTTDMPSRCKSRANSTIRMAFLLARAIIGTGPIWG